MEEEKTDINESRKRGKHMKRKTIKGRKKGKSDGAKRV